MSGKDTIELERKANREKHTNSKGECLGDRHRWTAVNPTVVGIQTINEPKRFLDAMGHIFIELTKDANYNIEIGMSSCCVPQLGSMTINIMIGIPENEVGRDHQLGIR